MTNIKCADGENVQIDASQQFDNHTFIYFMNAREATHVPTADLLAALDATANTEVKHRADAYEAATRAEQERDEYRLKAVALDAERDEWKARAEDAEAFGAAAVTRAEKAEAAIQRVRDVRNEWSKTLGRSGHVVEIDDALADKPAFTLPTEAGVQFEVFDGYVWETYTTYSDGNGNAISGCKGGFNDAARLMSSQFTDHRLIGAVS